MPALGIIFVLPHTYLFADARPCPFMNMSVNKALRMDLHVLLLFRSVTIVQFSSMSAHTATLFSDTVGFPNVQS